VLSYYNRGQIYCILNNFTSAIADLSKAIELNGDGVNALHDRGEMYFCVGEYTKAVDDMKQAALKNLTYASSYKSMLNRVGIKMNELYENGVSYFNDKNYEKADEYLKKVIEIYPNHNEANALLNEINVIRG
jgi:tetratricopeptide (TPR) repeat protein